MSEQQQDIWTQFHDLGHPTTFLEPYKGAMLDHWLGLFNSLDASKEWCCLDIGTGNLPIPKILLGVKGLSISLHAIDTARINPLQIPPSPRLSYKQASIENSGFNDETFNLVTGCFALEYARPEQAVPELWRIMQPGGRGAFVMHHPESSSVVHAQSALSEDIPLILSSGIFEAMRDYIEQPVPTRRERVESVVSEKLQQAGLDRYWRITQLLKYVGQSLANPDPVKYERWQTRFMLDQQRMKALLNAVIPNQDHLEQLFTQAGFETDSIDVLAEAGDKGFKGHARAGDVLGWTVSISKPERG